MSATNGTRKLSKPDVYAADDDGDGGAFRLRKWHEMPQHLQFNKYVLDHYRPILDFKGTLLSLFYLHNETVNIFTHGRGCITLPT